MLARTLLFPGRAPGALPARVCSRSAGPRLTLWRILLQVFLPPLLLYDAAHMEMVLLWRVSGGGLAAPLGAQR